MALYGIACITCIVTFFEDGYHKSMIDVELVVTVLAVFALTLLGMYFYSIA